VADRAVIVVADDDPDISAHLELTLQREGYEVYVAADGAEVLDLARRTHPDLVLLDVEMPERDGFEACRTLRADAATADTPIIMVTGHDETEEKVVGLDAGADDYLAKPFATAELLARVRSVLRRTTALRASSPLTGLPGNDRIRAEIDRCLAAALPFALIYVDLDHFKAYNDHYGFLRGDDVIRFTADVVGRGLAALPDEPRFAGHVGGDDFVVLCPSAAVTALCTRIIAEFDGGIGEFYDADDRARGWLEVPDRRGERHRFPPVSISLGVVDTVARSVASAAEASELASEMKHVAKRRAGSTFVIDRRQR